MTTARTMDEAQLVRCILQLAAAHRWRAVHYRPARTNRGWRTALEGHAGAPDIIAVHPILGVLLIEAKSAKGRLEPEQVEWQAWCESAQVNNPGAIRYEVLRPVDWFSGRIDAILSGAAYV
jgi:hypothetical protein